MASRLELHEVLCTLLGSRHVYYQSPETVKMNYDAIQYSLDGINTEYANDKKYAQMKRYNVILITRLPDPEVLDKILELPYSSLGKPYTADNLNHYPITLYY